MSVNWSQIGEDFSQKYESTFCRYISPIDKAKHIFQINHVEVSDEGPSEFVLFNKKHGELFLKYDTDTELDFEYPDVGYFQLGKQAHRFSRLFMRQWKKGICDSTAKMSFPYARLAGGRWESYLNHDTLEGAFNGKTSNDLSSAVKLLDNESYVSVALTKRLAVGLGNKTDEKWLWFEEEPIAVVTADKINVKMISFIQEVKDFLRDTRDYARALV